MLVKWFEAFELPYFYFGLFTAFDCGRMRKFEPEGENGALIDST